MTAEKRKPIKHSIAEVQKAAKHCRYLRDNLDDLMREDPVKTDFKKSVIQYQPLGPIFFVAPFNFPFWLIFKGAAPALAMGNTILSKVASSCPKTGLIVEEAFKDAGFDSGEFQYIGSSQDQSELIISNKHVKGVSFTGSTHGGSVIAGLAGKYTKKSVLELGGSDPCLVLKDADVDLAVSIAISSRLRNGGQVCSSAKRFIIHESVFDQYRDKLVEKISKINIGDPMKKETDLGPLATKRVLDEVLSQVNEGVKQGGNLIYGGKRPEGDEYKNGHYFIPAVVEVSDDSNILFQEEVFGPVFALIKFKIEEEAIKIANNTQYGLAGVIVSKDEERAQNIALEIECGNLAINSAVASDSRLPSGGIKESGYGRECHSIGAHEFTNVKTLIIK